MFFRPRKFHALLNLLLWLGFDLALARGAGRNGELPGPEEARVEGAETERREQSVAQRPRLYRLKRAVNPLNWAGAALEKISLAAEAPLKGRLEERPAPKRRGMIFGLGRAGGGSGFGPEVGYLDRNLFGRGIDLRIPLLVTYKNYQVFRVESTIPLLENLDFDLAADYRSRTRDSFFGIGNDTPFSDRSRYRRVSRELRGGLSSDFGAVSLGFHLSYRSVGLTEPSGSPSAQDVFAGRSVPGLAEGAKLIGAIVTVVSDTRDNRYLPSRGTLREAQVSLNEGLGKGNFAYWKYRAEVQHFVPLSSRGDKLLAFRGLFETNQEKGGSQVPFFDMAWLGGSSTLRSRENFRYFDKTALALVAEYRYRIWRAFDWGLFAEAGQVAPEPGDLGWGRFHPGYGVRFLIRMSERRPVSIDLARGDEGWRIYFRYRPSF